ncbi:MAG: hypothetical protein HGA19_24480, partial [Oscillochloris sp.]|nr:hypothetical protein [Oscillochloris sp.]
ASAAAEALTPVRAYMAARLPEYMIPASFIELSAMPLSPNGKVERKALPAPSGERPEIDSIYTPPSTPAEQTLAQIWAEVLGVAQVGIHDNFFALGGDSIMTIQVIARAGTAGLRLTPRQLFEAPTVAGLAALAESSAADPAGPAVQAESSLDNDDADFSDFNWSQEDLQDILGAIEQSLDPQ